MKIKMSLDFHIDKFDTNSRVELTLENQFARGKRLRDYIHMVKLALNSCGIPGS